jgi:hypothetical protein
MKADPAKVRRMARDFRIWQVGHARGWDCTAAEIADELRMDPNGVGRICAARGWPVRTARQDQSAGFLGAFSASAFIAADYRRRLAEEPAE